MRDSSGKPGVRHERGLGADSPTRRGTPKVKIKAKFYLVKEVFNLTIEFTPIKEAFPQSTTNLNFHSEIEGLKGLRVTSFIL